MQPKKKQVQNFAPTDIFNGMFDEELKKIPVQMHERVALLIHRNVERRVSEYMSAFRHDVNAHLHSQHQEHQQLILQLQQETAHLVAAQGST